MIDLDLDEIYEINFHKLIDLTYKVTPVEFWLVIDKLNDHQKHNIQVNLGLSMVNFYNIFDRKSYKNYLDKREIIDRFYDVEDMDGQ